MKAIAIIDIPDLLEPCEIDEYGFMADMIVYPTTLTTKYGNMAYRYAPVLPFPYRRETNVHWKAIGGDIITHEISEYDKGWNDCIDWIESAKK